MKTKVKLIRYQTLSWLHEEGRQKGPNENNVFLSDVLRLLFFTHSDHAENWSLDFLELNTNSCYTFLKSQHTK